MKLFTSARCVSSAAAGFALEPMTAAASSRAFERRSARTVSSLLRPYELAMRMKRHQDPEARQQSDHRSAPIADHRQGYADDRQDAAHHTGIDEHIHEEAQCDGPPGQARKGVLSLHREVQRPPDHDAVQNQQHQAGQQTEFLADDRKDEVGGPLRQKLQLRLASHHVALAEHAAGADRDLGLDDVVAGAQRIVFGIQECQYALALIVMNEMPGGPGSAAEHRYRYQYDSKLQPSQQQHDESGGGDQQCGA